MIDDISFSAIDNVIKAWEIAKSTSEFSEKLGISTLDRLLTLDPEMYAIFGLDGFEQKPMGLRHMALLIHGKRILDMIDSTFGLLGPDAELLESFLSELGQRHHQMGVKPKHFDLLGEVLQSELRAILDKNWSSQIEQAWSEVFNAITNCIVKGMPQQDEAKTVRGAVSKVERKPASQ